MGLEDEVEDGKYVTVGEGDKTVRELPDFEKNGREITGSHGQNGSANNRDDISLDDNIIRDGADTIILEDSNKPREAVSTISEAARVLADRLLFISEVAGNPKKSKEAGYTTGSNLAVIEKTLKRALHGEISIQEAISLASNVSSMLEGYFHTASAYSEVEKELKQLRKMALEKMARGKK